MKLATCLMVVAGLSTITAACGELDDAGNPIATDPAGTDPAAVTPGETTSGEPTADATETVTGALSIGNMNIGEMLYPGQRLVASQCYYHLRMQGDGNLVLYAGPTAATPLWSSKTAGFTGGYAAMQRDGNLVVYDRLGTARFATHTEGVSNMRLAMQNDGNLVLYQGKTAFWSSKTARAAHSWPCADAPQSETTFIEKGFDRLGGDYRGIRTTGGVHYCGTQCAADAKCKAFTYVPSGINDPTYALCYLKDSVPPAVADSRGLYSGVKQFAAASN